MQQVTLHCNIENLTVNNSLNIEEHQVFYIHRRIYKTAKKCGKEIANKFAHVFP